MTDMKIRPVFDKKEVSQLDDAKRTYPITPLENYALLFEGKTPYWVPADGWGTCDLNCFRPRINPDNIASRLVFDGEPEVVYTSDIYRGWFDLEWVWVPIAEGSTVRPGSPKVPDINEWEKYVQMPNLDELDWEGCAKNNKEYLDTTKMNQLGMYTGGLWERLMSLMDVANASIALVDEDQQEGVHRFFDQYADFIIDYIRRTKECCDIDCVLLHDDWGHQNGPFFSLDTAMEMLVPYLKRIIDYVHSRGMFFELHSCGKNELLVPAYIAAGVDLWCPQQINDYEMLAKTYKDDPIAFVLEVVSDPESSDEEVYQAAQAWFDKYGTYKVAFKEYGDGRFRNALYEISRKAYSK